MNLKNAEVGLEYLIHAVDTDDEEMDAFLFIGILGNTFK